MKVPVIFKKEGSSVLAVFPTLIGTNDPYTVACYARAGQHASADAAYVSSLPSAKPHEYASLLEELNKIGYDLEVRQRISRHDLELRRKQAR